MYKEDERRALFYIIYPHKTPLSVNERLATFFNDYVLKASDQKNFNSGI